MSAMQHFSNKSFHIAQSTDHGLQYFPSMMQFRQRILYPKEKYISKEILKIQILPKTGCVVKCIEKKKLQPLINQMCKLVDSCALQS